MSFRDWIMGQKKKASGLLKFGYFGGSAIASGVLAMAFGLTDGRSFAVIAKWVVIAAGISCLMRSPIHIIWGKYLTWRPSRSPSHRFERTELNVLVPLNVLFSGCWIWWAYANLDNGAPSAAPPLALFVLVTLVAMETVRCARRTGKRRGTEIVCEGPLGDWFREFFETSSEGTGFMHKIMIFLRNPNHPKTISRFLMLVTALLLLPFSVHASTAVGHRLNRLLSGSPTPNITNSGDSSDQEEEQVDNGETGQSSVENPNESWEAQCGAVYDGRPSPSPNREQLAVVFKAAGSKAAGCPHPAEKVHDQEGVWYARSFCGPELRSVGVTSPDYGYLPSILYQQAARFALARAKEGVLRGTSSRWSHEGGDLYVVDTSAGSFVLARRRASAEESGSSGSGSLPCHSYSAGNVPYTVLPPGLVELWLEVAATEWVWPRGVSESGSSRSFEFVPAYPSREVVATATCVSDVQCTLSYQGAIRTTPGTLYNTSISEIDSVAH
jgi:hypothetical protein